MITLDSTNKTLLNKFQVMQNKILLIIDYKCLKDRIKMNSLFKSMNILKIKDIYELEMAKFMYLYYPNKLTLNFDQYTYYVCWQSPQLYY